MRKKKTEKKNMAWEERREALHEVLDIVLDAMEHGAEDCIALEAAADRGLEHGRVTFTFMKNGFDMERNFDYMYLFETGDTEKFRKMLACARRLSGKKAPQPDKAGGA